MGSLGFENILHGEFIAQLPLNFQLSAQNSFPYVPDKKKERINNLNKKLGTS